MSDHSDIIVESSAEFLARLGTDGAKWAAEFRRIAINLGYSDMDEGWLIGWFANAIEAGADRSRAADEIARLREALAEERERCARIAETAPDNVTRHGIAAAIRSGTSQE